MVRSEVVDDSHAGQRIDNYLISLCKGVPKSRIYRAIRKGEVRVNKKRINAEYRLQERDVVRIPPLRVAERNEQPVLTDSMRKSIESNILFEDNTLILVNKPAGMAVHGGSGIKLGLVEAMRLLKPRCKFIELAHRLDRDTSGCLLLVKKSSVLKQIHEMLREKDMDKRYLALVHGKVDFRKKTIDFPLSTGVVSNGERFVQTSKSGKKAVTKVNTLQVFENSSLLSITLLTGRTHQIRVHLKAIGFPIVGDDKYGDRELDKLLFNVIPKRMYLHAAALSFNRPDNETKFAICALPDSKFSTAIKRLG